MSNVLPDPEQTVSTSIPAVASAPVTIPATPVTAAYQVSDVPTISLPFTKATKSHIAAAITAVLGLGQLALDVFPVGHVTQYIAAGVAVVGVGASWLGVYVAPNLPKITKTQ